jgi:glycosyltransferase involved in cell wall biosynthesis
VERTSCQLSKSLSIIIPAKDEAENISALLNEIKISFSALIDNPKKKHPLDWFEIIVVNDGSTDQTAFLLDDLQRTVPELRSLNLVRSVGQSAATIAGFRIAQGEWVAVLDADLQNRPEDLATLWEALPGYDAALGWRTKREDRWSKRIISRWANRIRNKIFQQSIKDTGCSVRIFRRDIALRLPVFQGVHRFFGPLLLREGCKIIQLPVTHRPRQHGCSHYNIWNRSIRVLVDLLGVAWLMKRSIQYEVLNQTTKSSLENRPTKNYRGSVTNHLQNG